MARFLLIHGASHGAWAWRKFVPRLEALGHRTRAIDLPSHGDDPRPPESVTMEDCVAACCAALEPGTVLVAHSLGGLTATLAAARMPERVSKLVYLCAWIPRSGLALQDYRRDGATRALRRAITVDRKRGVTVPIPGPTAEVFYPDCSEEDRAFALARLTPQPISVMSTVLDFAPPPMPRFYIRCLRDRAIDPAYQTGVTTGWPQGHVFDMDTGHSPFFTDPARLAEILDQIAKT